MTVRLELEHARLRVLVTRNTPAGDDAGRIGHVGLIVARLDATVCQLQQFAAKIFVQPLLLLEPSLGIGAKDTWLSR